MDVSPESFALLRLKLAPGLGPILIDRVLEKYPSGVAAVETIEAHGAKALAGIERLGAQTARGIAGAMASTRESAEKELRELEAIGARLYGLSDPGYPALLRQIPGAPVTISVRGALDAERDRFGVAIVGSRKCSAYGAEQSARFASGLGSAGLTIVSGGARGIDTQAHAAALRAGARTIVVLGCGLSHCYPPENRGLFQDVVDAGGAVVSELAAGAAPESKNFPARNRIISGMSLGVVVIEAGRRSGALITARQAVEEQGREVLAVPGRVDSSASEGCHELLKQGAGLATSPADVLEALEGPARHAYGATFGSRYAGGATNAGHEPEAARALPGDLSDAQRVICEALTEPRTLDELARGTGLAAELLRSETTMLELRRVLVRDGARLRVREGR